MTRLSFTFQEASPLVSYSQRWAEGTAGDPQHGKYDGSFRVTSTGGTTASFNFTGSAVSISGAARGNHGNYTVNLDQRPPFSGVGNLTQDVFNRTLFNADNLEYGQHTVEIINVPTTSNQIWLDLDFFTIERQIGKEGDPVFEFTLDDTAPSIQYLGTWDPLRSIDTAHQGTLHSTSVGGSQAVITFFGCCVEIYGQYENALYSVSVDNQPPTNMKGLDVDLPPALKHPQTLLYLLDGLSETENHTVTLTNTNSYPNRPFSIDYAVLRSTHNITAEQNSIKLSVPHNATGGAGGSNPTMLAEKASAPMGAIVAAAICGTAVIFALLCVVYVLARRRSRKAAERAYRLNLDLNDEPEPKPILSPYNIESFRSRSVSSISTDVTEPERAYHSRISHHSQDGLLSPEEQYAAETASNSYGASSSSQTMTTRSTRTSTYKSMAGPSRLPHKPAAQEEDAGVVLGPGDESMVASLPPAYNAEWHHRTTEKS